MEDDKEFIKLPVEERCVHKLWKARIHGYEEAIKIFMQIDDEKSPEWNKYLGLLKKFVVDSHAAAQEKGLEAVLAYVENSAAAGKTVGEVMSGIVGKCIGAPKVKTKELAVKITLMYIEIEKMEQVLDELVKGMDHKNPKVVAACVAAATQALREFGSKVITVKPLVKKIAVLLEDRDKAVREEGKALAIEIYRWIGDALKPQLSSLKPIQVSELEAEFEKVKGSKPVPTRYIRSQQKKQALAATEAVVGGCGDGGEDEADGDVPEVDPYDMLDPVDILSKLPKDFYEKLEAKKWQERKEAVDQLEQILVTSPKLENGDYGDLVRALKKAIAKDSNVMVVAVACKCLGLIAAGLKKRFQTYASACLPSLLEKFREKKQNVVLALRDAIDAVALSMSLDNMQEDIISALDNKNPSVKAETAAFLARLFTRCTPAVLAKKTVKVLITPLLKTLNESDPTVRDNSADAIGTLLKAAGEKLVLPYLADVDALKTAKIKECCEKAVIVAKVPKKVERPTTAPAKAPSAGAPRAGSAAPVPVKRPQTAGAPAKKGAVPKKAPVKGKGAKSGAGGPSVAAAVVEITEKEISQDEADEKAAEIFSSELLAGLADANWKTRLTMVEQFTQELNKMDKEDIQTQVLLRTLDKKPGLRDSNVQVAKARLEALKILVENSKFSRTCVELCTGAVTERLGEAKLGPVAAEVLTAMAESTSLETVALMVLDAAFALRSPKTHQESLSWLNGAVKEFGFTFPVKYIVENIKKALNASNPAVRNSALTLLGTLSLYVGPNIRTLFSDEKAAVVQFIDAEIDKHSGERPPTPTRGQTKAAPVATNGVLEEEDEVMENEGEDLQGYADDDLDDPEVAGQASQPEQQLPRQDLSHHFTEELANELRDKNWKVRNEALQRIYTIVSEAKSITANLGELPAVLAQRLVDSNKIIAVIALQLTQELAVAMGPRCKQHARTLVPGMLQGLGDNKASVRQAALASLRAWGENCGVKEFFEGEMILDALRAGNPQLRSELWLWIAEKLTEVKSLPKDELVGCLPILYACVEDRNADVRKNAQEAILPFMMHVGYDPMVRNAGKLKPGSNKLVMPLLTKASACLPPPPAPTSRGDASKAKGGGGQSAPVASRAAQSATTRKKVAVVNPAISSVGLGKGAAGRRKEEESDSSPLLQANNLKSQRVSDEQKLKVLKWNFTAPREEFVELLRDQMTTANVNKSIMNNMFHADFKYHLKAIDSLNDDLSINPDALVANLDLILKWMTLRFFDTNPSVLLKGLEYLQSVFGLLIEEEYNMLEYEASSFIPYLILKVGDPKDAVRNSVRALFKQIGLIYPVSKLFAYVMEGLKSKNARQRTECLDELGSLIENYGISVCQPTPAAALREVAKQISDRDNSVRNAALNCVVRAYFLEGERVYKMVGQISDKDMSLLEERIKRAAKNRPPPANRLVVVPDNVPKRQKPQVPQQPPPQVVTKQSGLKNKTISQEDILQDDAVPQQEATPIVRVSPKVRPISGPFHLDYDLLERMGDKPSDITKVAPQLVKHDLEGLLDDTSPAYLKSKELSPRLQAPGLPLSLVKLSPSPRREEVQHLDLIISQIASQESNSCQSALLQVDNLLHSEKADTLCGHVDQLVVAVTMQLRLLQSSSSSSKLGNHFPAEEVTSQTYSQILACLMSLFNHQSLACKVSRDVLRDLVWNLISVLHDGRIEMLDGGVNFCRAINVLVVRIIERSDHTNLICALIRSLHDCVESPHMPPKFLELIQKCLWKVAKLLPDWEDDICLDVVLYDIHKFLMAFPKKVWKDRQSDLPFRTVRTVVHHLYKVKGRAIMSHLGRIENLRDSELHEYLIKLMKMEEKEGRPAGGGASAKEGKSSGRISKSTHAILSEIFNKIGSKSQTKEGLALLYDFKLQHPEADVEPFLSKSSQFFQDYIERGLRVIEIERRRTGVTDPNVTASLDGGVNSKASSMCSSIGVLASPDMKSFMTSDKGQAQVGMLEDPMNSGQPQRNPQYFLERLRQLQAQAGIDPLEIAEGGKAASVGSQEIISTKSSSDRQHVIHQEDNRGSTDENLNHRLQNNELGLARSLPRSRSTDENVGTAIEVDTLRKRLEKLTGGIQR